MANVEPIHQPNENDIIAHLEFLFGDVTLDGRIEICGLQKGQAPIAQTFETTDLEDAASFAAQTNRQGFNVYVGNALLSPDVPPFGRADDDDYLATVAAYVDLDDQGSVTHAQTTLSEIGLSPSAYVVTGQHPHPRLQLWFKFHDPIESASDHREIMATLAGALRGDGVVTNPSRIMRLGGSIAWAAKPGRITEPTSFNKAKGQRFEPAQIKRALQNFRTHSPVTETTSEAPRSTLTGRIDILRTLDATRQAGAWHSNMVAAVASMVRRNWSDEQIRLAVAPYCSGGAYDQDLNPILRTARQKWETPDPGDNEHPTPADDDPPPPPFRASDLIGNPPERKWLVPDWVPMNTVTSLYGDGGTGKTLLAQQLAYSCAIEGAMWLGQETALTESLCVFCEDQRDELHRRHNAISGGMGYPMGNPFERVSLWPRVGFDNMLVTFDGNGLPQETPFLQRVVQEALDRKVGLLILDTAADLFGGNEIVRSEVNHFVKAVCGKAIRLANEQGRDLSVILLAHPSVAGMQTKTGLSGSTAWNGAVRSRLYLSKVDDADPDMRILTRMKANYAAAGDDTGIPLFFKDGILVPMRTTLTTLESQKLSNLKERMKAEIDRAWNEGRPYSHQGALPLRRLASVFPDDDRNLTARAIEDLKADQDIILARTKEARGYKINTGLSGDT